MKKSPCTYCKHLPPHYADQDCLQKAIERRDKIIKALKTSLVHACFDRNFARRSAKANMRVIMRYRKRMEKLQRYASHLENYGQILLKRLGR